ncbi:MAG TPA: cobalt transporter CbiM [Acidimicrobiales bacterium]|jgi:cobalt/nickel transport system permease protein
MHIPDGYLSPSTCATFGAGMVPAWLAASRRVRKTVKSRYVPLLALGSAYCFLVMMFNVPIPDGTTAHAVGGVLVAVLLGPWAAVIAVSTALLIQALFFGDGGVLAYGANCFNMALVMPLTGYAVYRLLSRRVSLTSSRRALAAGIGGYVGLNVAALCTAIELGVQPDLFKDAHGTPLYAPFHVSQTVPAMLGAHLLVAGVVEAALTVGVVAYLQRANLPVLRINHATIAENDEDIAPPARLGWRWAWIGLGTLVVLTPLGLLAPGSAFGEDSPQNLDLQRYHLDAVPRGLAHYGGFWHNALFDGYDFTGDKHPTIGYLVSALFGTAVIGIVLYVSGKALQRRQRVPRTQRVQDPPRGREKVSTP